MQAENRLILSRKVNQSLYMHFKFLEILDEMISHSGCTSFAGTRGGFCDNIFSVVVCHGRKCQMSRPERI